MAGWLDVILSENTKNRKMIKNGKCHRDWCNGGLGGFEAGTDARTGREEARPPVPLAEDDLDP